MAPISRMANKLTGSARASIRANKGINNTQRKVAQYKEIKRQNKISSSQSYARDVLAKSPKAQPNKEAQAALKQRLQNRERGGQSRFANPKRASQEEIAQYADSVVTRQHKGYMNRAKELGLTDKSTSYKATGPAFQPKVKQTVFSANRGNPNLDPDMKILARSTRLPGDKTMDGLVKQTSARYTNNVLHAGDPLNKVKPRKPVPVERFAPNKLSDAVINNLNKMDSQKINGGFRGAGVTGRTLFAGAKNHFLDPANGAARRKSAYKGTFQAAAVSAAGHAGVAALSGDDPWEAAKTGAIRGALVGGGYQSFKGATGANASSVWGNMKHISTTTKGVYGATTVKGREQLRKEGASGSLSTLLSMESGVAQNKGIFGRKGNTTTAQMMNQ